MAFSSFSCIKCNEFNRKIILFTWYKWIFFKYLLLHIKSKLFILLITSTSWKFTFKCRYKWLIYWFFLQRLIKHVLIFVYLWNKEGWCCLKINLTNVQSCNLYLPSWQKEILVINANDANVASGHISWGLYVDAVSLVMWDVEDDKAWGFEDIQPAFLTPVGSSQDNSSRRFKLGRFTKRGLHEDV